jgi:hypothetical protein
MLSFCGVPLILSAMAVLFGRRTGKNIETSTSDVRQIIKVVLGNGEKQKV